MTRHRRLSVSRTRRAAVNTGMQKGLMLEEIHVPPRLFLDIMHRTVLAADRAREVASLGKVDVQIQPLLLNLEDYVIHHPRRNQTQSQGEQLVLLHFIPLLSSRYITIFYPSTHMKC